MYLVRYGEIELDEVLFKSKNNCIILILLVSGIIVQWDKIKDKI